MKKLLVILLLGLFMISFASAGISKLAPVKINDCINIKQVCGSCSFVNVSVSFPNSTLAITNKGMVNQGGGTWTYEFCDTLEKGRYDVIGLGDLNGVNTGFDVLYFEVSPTGKELTQAKGNLYTIILIVSILIFLGLLFVGLKLPSKNKSEELTGYIIAVSNLKYLKHFLLGFSYLTLVWISYFIWMFIFSYLDFTFLETLFKFMFYFLVALILPLFILYIYLTITNFIRDKDIKDFLLRGIRIR